MVERGHEINRATFTLISGTDILTPESKLPKKLTKIEDLSKCVRN